ncbi:SANT/Myb_domain [Hexamita inflata]|uniref:SANT/Myb domain n=1 Tax=Hexamita inflata TaxID=28002 RepID=A0AA86PYY6_9EUKA|nr:SANT/Myb domain [Hexamita inflata]
MKYGQVWTEEDLQQFLDLFEKYDTDFRQIAQEMNRTYSQIRSHYYNLLRKPSNPARKREEKEIQPGALKDEKAASSHQTDKQKTNSNTSQPSSENRETSAGKYKQADNDLVSFIRFDEME